MFARKVQHNQPGKPSLRTRNFLEQQQKGTQQQDPATPILTTIVQP